MSNKMQIEKSVPVKRTFAQKLKMLWKRFVIFFQTSRSKAYVFIAVGILMVVQFGQIGVDLKEDTVLKQELNTSSPITYDNFIKKLKANDFVSTRVFRLSSWGVDAHQEWVYYDANGQSWRTNFKLNEAENNKIQLAPDVQESMNRLQTLPDKHTNWQDVVGNIRMMFILVAMGFLILAMQFIIESVVAGKNFITSHRNLNVSFDDIVGYKEVKREFMEFKDYLSNKAEYKKHNITLARGILLKGHPGVGKTLFAKALANELNYTLYTMTGSDFVELYAGVGARRVRALFARARLTAPSLIFIDEIDALGSRNQAHLDSERQTTLNQMLAEMDGMGERRDVLVVGATNYESRLDAAMIRPGRFDSKIEIPLPDAETRKELLSFYLRNHSYAPEIDLVQLAHHLPRATGADIRNLVEKATLQAFRRDKEHPVISDRDFESAMEELAIGLVKQINSEPDERKRIAYHEICHAVAIIRRKPSQTVRKVSMIGRNGMLGFTWSAENLEKKIYTEEELLANLVVLYGGRAGEQVFMGNVSSGASDDLDKASTLARQMVCEWGMSELGLATCKVAADVALPKPQTEAIQKILGHAYDEAIKLMKFERDGIENAHISLMEKDEISGEELIKLLDKGHPLATKNEAAIAGFAIL